MTWQCRFRYNRSICQSHSNIQLPTKSSHDVNLHPAVDLKIDGDCIDVVIVTEGRTTGALQGLTRSLVANMITGVTQGFERTLEINGIGYRAELKEKQIVFNLGFSAQACSTMLTIISLSVCSMVFDLKFPNKGTLNLKINSKSVLLKAIIAN